MRRLKRVLFKFLFEPLRLSALTFQYYRSCVCILFLTLSSWGYAWNVGELTVEEKVGQLFMAPACPDFNETHYAALADLIGRYHIGGVILKQGTLKEHFALITHLKAIEKIPLLRAKDAEWGLSMQMRIGIAFPKNQELGKIQDLALIEAFGRELGRTCRLAGVHINLAPVADIHTNPNNPIIGGRSFGSDPHHVAAVAVAVAKGIQAEGVIACGKHFPGHGDTAVDSHLSLPIIPWDIARLDAVELVPFRALAALPVGAMMAGHLAVPALDPTSLPISLSPVLKSLLVEEWGYEGLLITDALNMEGAIEGRSIEEEALLAFHAGNHLLLYGFHLSSVVEALISNWIPRAHTAICAAVRSGRITTEDLDARVQKILDVKESLGLGSEKKVWEHSELVGQQIESDEADALKKKLLEVISLCKSND